MSKFIGNTVFFFIAVLFRRSFETSSLLHDIGYLNRFPNNQYRVERTWPPFHGGYQFKRNNRIYITWNFWKQTDSLFFLATISRHSPDWKVQLIPLLSNRTMQQPTDRLLASKQTELSTQIRICEESLSLSTVIITQIRICRIIIVCDYWVLIHSD